MNHQIRKTLAQKSGEMGGRLFGVADITPYRKHLRLTDKELNGLTRAICVAVPLSPAVLEGISDRPTLLYKWHYRQANILLDRIAFNLSQIIVQQKGRALPIPASQIIDWEKQVGHVSHRSIGELAGLGWRGRNNLLVNPEYGSMIRLVTVLTDLPLTPDEPMEDQCGSCYDCVDRCPAGALSDSYKAYDFEKCFTLLKSFSKIQGVGTYICGICVQACPGKKD